MKTSSESDSVIASSEQECNCVSFVVNSASFCVLTDDRPTINAAIDLLCMGAQAESIQLGSEDPQSSLIRLPDSAIVCLSECVREFGTTQVQLCWVVPNGDPVSLARVTNGRLTVLNLRHCQSLGPAGACEVADRIRGGEIQRLALAYTYIQDEGMRAICAALMDSRTLKELDLSSNSFTDIAMDYLSKLLQKTGTLSTLKLEGLRINSLGAGWLASGIARNRSVANLHIGHSSHNDEAVKQIALAMCENKGVVYLGLEFSTIQSAGATHLGLMLEKNCSLRVLDLSFNKLRDEMQPIAQGLARNHSLRELNLGVNKIRDQGATELAAGLGKNMGLRSLRLSSNKFGSVGARALMDAMVMNKTHETLDIKGNWLTESCVAELIKRANGAGITLIVGNQRYR